MKLIFKSCQKITTEKTSCVDRTTEKGGISGAHPFFQIVYMIHDKLSSFSERMYGTWHLKGKMEKAHTSLSNHNFSSLERIPLQTMASV